MESPGAHNWIRFFRGFFFDTFASKDPDTMISVLRLANGLLNGTTDFQERRPQDGQTLMPFSRLPNMEIRMNHASTINLWMKMTVKRTIAMNRSFN